MKQRDEIVRQRDKIESETESQGSKTDKIENETERQDG